MFAVHGPALVDYIYIVDSYPEKGGHAIVLATSKSPGGAGANVAHNVASLGVESCLYTSLGNDDDAKFFIDNTLANVVAEKTDNKTGKVLVFVDKNGERTFFVEPNAAGKPIKNVRKAEYLYFDPFPTNKSFEIQKKIAEKFSGFKIVNPGFPYVKLGFNKIKELFELVNMVIMSKDEFNALNTSVSEILKIVEYLIITAGSEGSVCYTRREKFEAEAFKVKVVDTTGAGDAFAAGFLYCFMRGFPINVCLSFGNFCGAYNVQKIGARVFPDRNTIEEFLARVLR